MERFNRIIKIGCGNFFLAYNNIIYYDKIDNLIVKYNSKKHSLVKMSPVKASKKNNESVILFLGKTTTQNLKLSFEDKVRISKSKRKIFHKGCRPKRTKELL